MDIILCDHTLKKLVSSITSRLVQVTHLERDDSFITLVAIGSSGSGVVEGILASLPVELKKRTQSATVLVSESGAKLSGLPPGIRGNQFVVCDGIVNTGKTMDKVRTELVRNGAAGVRTLALVLRNGSAHIPNLYLMAVGSHDEIFFGDELYPARFYANGCIRVARDSDRGAAVDHQTPYLLQRVGEYLDAHEGGEGWKTYLIENATGSVVGILHFQHTHKGKSGTVFVDTLAVSLSEQRNGYGAALLNFLEDYSKFNGVVRARMFSIASKVNTYEKFGYRRTGNVRKATESGEFVEMEMKYGYNV